MVEFSSQAASAVELGFGRTLNLVFLIISNRPSVVVADVANNWKLVMQTAGNWFSPLAMQDAFCLVCWFCCSFVSEACACFGEWL